VIAGSCHSDDAALNSREWPTEFVAVPRKGEMIQAADGTRCFVSAVVHFDERPGPAWFSAPAPKILVELSNHCHA